MFTLLVAPTLDREAFRAAAEADGFAVTADPPLTDVRRETVLHRHDDAAVLFAGATDASVAVVRLNEQARSLRAALGSQLVSVQEFLARSSQLRGRIARLRFAHDVLFLARKATEEADQAPSLAALFSLLEDDDEVVAHATARGLAFFANHTIADALERVAQRRPRLRTLADQARTNASASAEGTLLDTPTDDYWTLYSRAQEGVERQQWKRVLAATEAILSQEIRDDDLAALTWRGLALEATGHPLLALGHLGAARVTQELRAAAEKKDDAAQADPDEDDEDSGDGDDRQAALVAQIEQGLARLRSLAAAQPVSEREQEAPALSAWLDALSSHRASTLRAGAAREWLELVPSLTPRLLWYTASYDEDLEPCRRLCELVRDSRAALLLYARALDRAGRQDAALQVLRDARGCTPRSEAARWLEQISPVSDQEIEEKLLEITYENKRYAEAAALADPFVTRFPRSQLGWQIRANARLFAGQMEEAVQAYGEAIAALGSLLDTPTEEDSIRFGDDPRGSMHFNRCCALSKLGRHDEAIDALRRAVRFTPRFAADATEDDWLAPLFARADFQAIVAQSPDALTLPEERSAPFVAGLIDRAQHLDYVEGDTDEALAVASRAASLAHTLGEVTLEMKALGLLGRLQLSQQEREEGMQTLQQAIALSADERVPVADRAEVVHSLGHAHRALGDWDEAARVYADAMALRQQAHGEQSPIVAKSHSDLAVLAQARGAPLAVLLGHLRDAIVVLEAFLASPAAATPERASARLEALVDLGTNRMNESRLLMGEGDMAGAVTAGERSVTAFEDAVRGGDHIRQTLLEQEVDRYGALADDAPSHRDEFRALFVRLEEVLLPGTPAERAERRYWRQWRSLATGALDQGMSGGEFAGLMSRALRGDLPEHLAAIPLFRGFASEMAQRFARYQSFLVMLPIALSTASASDDILKSLEDIEELCVGSLSVDEPL